MYYCNDCREEFETPKREQETFEEKFNIDKLFSSRTKIDILKCPFCNSEEIEEMMTCDRCGEFCRYEDLIDTEGLTGGGVGYYCPDCANDCEIGG